MSRAYNISKEFKKRIIIMPPLKEIEKDDEIKVR